MLTNTFEVSVLESVKSLVCILDEDVDNDCIPTDSTEDLMLPL